MRPDDQRDDADVAVAMETGELPPITRDPSKPLKRPRFRPVRLTLKVGAFALVVYIFVLPLIPGFRDAAHELTRVDPFFLVLGLALQIASWYTYSLLTRSALGDGRGHISRLRMFRIQMSTKALSNIVPGGSAASSALGYRLMTLSGATGPDAGFALATAGLASAVVLNLLFWTALLVSIPFRGVNPLYVTAALAGLGIMIVVAAIVVGLQHGQGRAEKFLRWLGRKLHFDGDTATSALRQIGQRLEELIADRSLLKRVALWASLNWLLDAASLWVFVWAFGGALDIDALLIAFGLANIFAVIPITPGGLGIVEGVYIPTLIGFGLTRQEATLGVASYRLAQFWFPILLGGILYASLRLGPWSISRRDRLDRLRDIARRETAESERRLEFAMRQWERKRPGEPLPIDEKGHIVLPFDVDPELVAALDALPEGMYERAAATGRRRRSVLAGRRRGEGVGAPAGPVASAPMTAYDRPFGRHLEDFVVGDVYRHWPGKTITEYDDHLFCMITMNHHPLHTNVWFGEQSVQGRNVVVGNLVYSLVLGMSVPDVSGAAIANLEVETLQHKFPTFHGDTIHAETRVLDVKESSSKPDRGIVTVESKGFNQDGQEVCYFRRRVMVWKRDAAPDRTRPYDVDHAWD